MTYCVGLKLRRGLVLMSDTRTNAGVDNISTFKKLFVWESPGERSITILTAGNLATTQSVVSILDQHTKDQGAESARTILTAPSMFNVAQLIGAVLRDVIARHSQETVVKAECPFSATLIVGGQVKGEEPRLFLIYPEGNFAEAAEDTPYFQTGETKYGRPILVRAFDPDMSFEDAAKLLMVSFDSTIKANLSVGLPLDMHIYQAGSLRTGICRRITPDDSYFEMISTSWGESLRQAVVALPPYILD